MLAPFLGGKTANDFRQGVNFAVAGATALSQDFFREMGLDLAIIPPYSLEVQMKWFRRVLRLLGPTDQGSTTYACTASLKYECSNGEVTSTHAYIPPHKREYTY